MFVGRKAKKLTQDSLVKAIQKGNCREMENLLSFLDPNQPDSSGKLPLHEAVKKGNKEMVQILLEQKADANLKDGENTVPHDYPMSDTMHNLLVDNGALPPYKIIGQKKLIGLLDISGHASKIPPQVLFRGVCYGFHSASIQAFLLGEGQTTHFNRRCFIMQKFYGQPEVWQQTLAEVLLKKNRIEEEKEGTLALTPEENLILEIPIFLEHISFSQYSHKYYSEWNGAKAHSLQDIRKTLPYVCSSELEKAGFCQVGPQFSGIYTKENLRQFFESLEQSIQHFSLTQRVAISLFGNGHAFAAGYDPTAPGGKPWALMDANILWIYPDRDVERILAHAFSMSPDIIPFSVSLFCTVAEYDKISECISAWRSMPEMKQMHEVTLEKSRLKNLEGFSWLNASLRIGNSSQTGELLKISFRDRFKNDLKKEMLYMLVIAFILVAAWPGEKTSGNAIFLAICLALLNTAFLTKIIRDRDTHLLNGIEQTCHGEAPFMSEGGIIIQPNTGPEEKSVLPARHIFPASPASNESSVTEDTGLTETSHLKKQDRNCA